MGARSTATRMMLKEPERLISIADAMRLLGQSRENFYRLEKAIPDFPRRVYPNGPGSKAKLVLSEVERYIQKRIKERDRDVPPKRRIGRPVKPPEQGGAHEDIGDDNVRIRDEGAPPEGDPGSDTSI